MKTKIMNRAQSGASMIETLMVFPLMLFVGLGVVHLGLVYQAKSNLEYAALMAARVGSVTGISQNAMLTEVARRMSPSQIGSVAPSPANFSIQVLNPTVAMFQACGVQPLNVADCVVANICEIPNFGLQFRPGIAQCDGASIQDANILRIKVTYNFDSKVPLMNIRVFGTDHDSNKTPGVSISAIATVRMQTPARYTSIFN